MALADTDVRSLRRLLDYPREEMATEIKGWLDLSGRDVRARLAKELIALANYGGGYLLFGFVEADNGWSPSESCPSISSSTRRTQSTTSSTSLRARLRVRCAPRPAGDVVGACAHGRSAGHSPEQSSASASTVRQFLSVPSTPSARMTSAAVRPATWELSP